MEEQTQIADEDVVSEELENLFSDETESGTEDAKVEARGLDLSKLKEVAKRDFKDEEDFLKHYENLKKLVGDQEAAKARKEAKDPSKEDEVETLKTELFQMKKESAQDKFLLKNPTAQNYLDVVEAYAEKNNMTLDEAWSSDKFKAIAEAEVSRSKQLITKQRINPVQSQRLEQLTKIARQGSDEAQQALVAEKLGLNQ